MAASVLWLTAACLLAVWTRAMGDANAISVEVIAKRHQTILLPCRTNCSGTLSDRQWLIHFNYNWKQIIDSGEDAFGSTKYIRQGNASLTIKNPDWEGRLWHRCKCRQDAANYTDTAIDIIPDRPTSTKPHLVSSTTSPNKGSSGMNVTELSIVVPVLFIALACGAACFAWRRWRRIRGAEGQRASRDDLTNTASMPPVIYETVSCAQFEPGPPATNVAFNDVLYSVLHTARPIKMPTEEAREGTTMAHSQTDIHYAEAVIY